MGFLAIMLALMAMRQILALWGNYEHWNILIVGQLTELPGLVVSIMALLTIFFLKHIFTERRQIDEQLSYQANHDTLTGLVNRREFERRTERLLSTIQRDNGEHALCFMDLDQFKVVNDTCGHAAGDELLRQLGSVLTVTLRHRDTLARLGGDEFGILMEHCSLDDAHRVATSLQKAIQ